jgi:transcriptional regulator GlxA family with amidase domain
VARASADEHELYERAISLIEAALAGVDEVRVAAGRPSTERGRRALVDGARELMAATPDVSLPALGDALAVSPHHLSRIFKSTTGETVSRHRIRLRVRAALERIGGGEGNLARVAADSGFFDQAHLCRVLKSELGHAPSALRDTLAGG